MTRFAGCDLGQSSLKGVVVSLEADGRLTLEATSLVVHDGKPLDRFAEWYREHEIALCDRLGVTGIHARDLGAPARVSPKRAAILKRFSPVPEAHFSFST